MRRAAGRGHAQRLDPAHAFLFVERFGVAPARVEHFGRWPRPRLRLEHPQRHTVGSVRQQAVQEQTTAAVVIDRAQAAGLAQAREVEAGGVLGQQHHRLGRHARLRRLGVRGKHLRQTQGRARVLDQAIGRFGGGPRAEAAIKTGLGLRPARGQNLLGAPVPTHVAQVQRGQLVRAPEA